MVVLLGTPTGARWDPSAARLTVMAATLLKAEGGLQPVADGEPELREERSVVRAPVGEEVPDMLSEQPEEPAPPHPFMLPVRMLPRVRDR